MKIVNVDYIPGRELELLGLVKGSTIQSKHLGNDIMSGLKTLVGGELTAYSQMLDEAREIATKRMIEDAKKLGADAIINVRFTSSSIISGASEILVYGTAVKFELDDATQF
ncbi:MAG: YbjQ family protein [Cellulosilyticaceae bacterium]